MAKSIFWVSHSSFWPNVRPLSGTTRQGLFFHYFCPAVVFQWASMTCKNRIHVSTWAVLSLWLGSTESKGSRLKTNVIYGIPCSKWIRSTRPTVDGHWHKFQFIEKIGADTSTGQWCWYSDLRQAMSWTIISNWDTIIFPILVRAKFLSLGYGLLKSTSCRVHGIWMLKLPTSSSIRGASLQTFLLSLLGPRADYFTFLRIHTFRVLCRRCEKTWLRSCKWTNPLLLKILCLVALDT